MLKEQFLKRNERSAVRYLLKVLMYSNCFLLRVHFKILLSLRTLILITVSASFTCVIAFCGQGKRCGWEYMGGAKKKWNLWRGAELKRLLGICGSIRSARYGQFLQIGFPPA